MKGQYLSFKDAVEQLCARTGEVVSEAKIIKLTFMNPPIERFDMGTASALTNCEELRLSTNAISTMIPLTGMRNLKVLTLSRNSIRNIRLTDELGQTLEQLWLSYNIIDKLPVFSKMEKLQVFYLAHNKIKDWSEVDKLSEAPSLKVTVMRGNPMYGQLGDDLSRIEVLKRIPNLTMIDGRMVTNDDKKKAFADQATDG